MRQILFLGITAAILFPGCGADSPDSQDTAGEDARLAERSQEITNACSVKTFDLPCDPDGSGSKTECQGVCRLNTSGSPECVDVASLSPQPNMDGRLCGKAAATGPCQGVCQSGACNDSLFAAPGTPCQRVASGVTQHICTGMCQAGGTCAAVQTLDRKSVV